MSYAIPETRLRRWGMLFSAVAFLFSAPLVFLVPPGEAPDEPAHAGYVNHILESGSLPPIGNDLDQRSYEAYQPPLAYVVMATAVRACGFGGIDYPFVPDPAFAFQRGARAFLEPPPSAGLAKATAALRVARAANLVWLLLTTTAIVLICQRLARDPWVAAAAAAPFALAPQFLSVSAVAGNDAAVMALASLTTSWLACAALDGDGIPFLAGASALSGLALWAKASAVALAPAIVILAVLLFRARRWRGLLALLVPGVMVSSGWIAFQIGRTGSILPNPPTGWGGGSGMGRLVTEPWWVISLWGSFWGKMGWFNVPLPWLVYVLFVPPTIAVVWGAAGMFARDAVHRRAVLVLVSIVLANIALVTLYMVRVDWQPQGRYLMPSMAALAGLAAIGIDRFARSWARPVVRTISTASMAAAIVAAMAMVYAMIRAYGMPS